MTGGRVALAGHDALEHARASLSLSLPSSTSFCRLGDLGRGAPDAASSMPVSLARRASSPIHHLRAPRGRAGAIVSSISSTAPALATDCMSVALMPHSSRSRARLTLGRSGRAALSSATHAGSGAIGTRSGSGK
jgi:hypothetical protein